MSQINVKTISQNKDKWEFEVVIRQNTTSTHKVSLKKEYCKSLTKESNLSPKKLVKKSFEFLLDREPKESILKEFDLSVIQNYFPEYETEIKKEQ